MKMFLNGEEFYYRLRDLLQTSDDINNYKFNNKYHAITKDFDAFLESTVKKYIDAFRNLPLLKDQKQELLIQNGSLKHKIQYFEQVLYQKDSIIKGMELLLKQKQKTISDIQSCQASLQEVLSQHQKGDGRLSLLEKIEDLKHQLQESKLQILKSSVLINQLANQLQLKKNQYKSKLEQVQALKKISLQNIEKDLLHKHFKQIKELKFKHEQKISNLRDELWFIQKECQEWKQKYHNQLGFNLLTDNE